MSCNRSSGMSNSDRSRWKLTEQQWFEFEITVYNIHSAATWRRWPNDKKVWSGQGLATEYTWRSRSWRWLLVADPENNTQGLGAKMHSSNEATQRYPQRQASPTSKYQFFETPETIARTGLWGWACTCRSCWFPDLVSMSCCAGAGSLGAALWRHTYEMGKKNFANPCLSVVVAKCWFYGLWCETELMCSVFTAILTLMTGYLTVY